MNKPRAPMKDEAGLASLTATIKKISVWEDSEGKVRYMKFYDSQGNILFILEFSDAGAATSETWSIIRS